ncbi:MAG: hypothetical protein ACXVAM_09300 [Vulcanimicrobiaceae bacterium]
MRYAEEVAQNSESLRLTPAAITAAGRAFERASGRCECNGFACNAPTHQNKIVPHGAFWHSRCSAALDGHAHAALLHPHDDAENPNNYRVLCRACLE